MRPGGRTRPIVEALVSEIIAVGEAALERAVLMLLEIEKAVAEGAGAAALAAVLDNPARFAGRKLGLVASGGNIDTRILTSILMRGLVREGRLVRLRVNISDAPGALARVAGIVGAVGGNIVEVYHQRLFHDVPVKLAELDIVVETRDEGHAREIVTRLEGDGFRTRMMQDTAHGGGGGERSGRRAAQTARRHLCVRSLRGVAWATDDATPRRSACTSRREPHLCGHFACSDQAITSRAMTARPPVRLILSPSLLESVKLYRTRFLGHKFVSCGGPE